jgi:hypothetical protein
MLTAIAAVLMVLGMAALVKAPLLGAALIGIGYACYSQTTRTQRSEAASVFFGLCVLSMIIVGVAALLGAAFN